MARNNSTGTARGVSTPNDVASIRAENLQARLRAAKRDNPIISDTHQDTLFNAGCAAAFISRFHENTADAAGAGNSEEMQPNEHRGLSLLAACVASALFFEVEGRE